MWDKTSSINILVSFQYYFFFLKIVVQLITHNLSSQDKIFLNQKNLNSIFINQVPEGTDWKEVPTTAIWIA